MIVPLQIPGGPELLVVLLILLLVGGALAAVVYLVVRLSGRRDRLDELEARVDALEEERPTQR
ncbi:hypothetical protein SAMN04487948_101147 [Halogranum amylolyticum]|uniref:Uncharacterized protein n=1 Tax=Halogranum amylolyticum TaxID=660520 RepID=A0A1H8MWI5_9EURY|nr:hypothetical protein [Halogranum amylolyticum]SEO21771.1 hypothetical protein SAMN04487948_101147 [Halogranum amylolyticum]